MTDHVGYFITAIFISIFAIHHSEAASFYGCVREREDKRLHRCLSKWSVFGNDREPSAFLTDESVVQEICGGGASIASVDGCITRAVSPVCDNILAYWSGTRDMYTFICQRQTDFYRYSRCRNNRRFIMMFEKCLSTNVQRIHAGMDYCLSVHIMQSCFTRALSENCSPSATEFFTLVFDADLAPSIAYSRCPTFTTDAVDVEAIEVARHNKRLQANNEVVNESNTPVRNNKPEPKEETDNTYREAAFAMDYTSRSSSIHKATIPIQLRVFDIIQIISCPFVVLVAYALITD